MKANQARQFLKRYKDPVNKTPVQDDVYKINCKIVVFLCRSTKRVFVYQS